MLNFRIVPHPGWSALSTIISYKCLYSVFILFVLSWLLLFLALIPPQPINKSVLLGHSLSTTLLSSTTANPGHVSHTLAPFWSLLVVVFGFVAFPLPLWFSDSLFLSQFYFSSSLNETSWLTGSFPYFYSEKVLLTLMNKELIFVRLKGKELSVCNIKDYNGLPFVCTL